MNIKVAAFAVSEKLSNTVPIVHMGFCIWFLFCDTILFVLSSFAHCGKENEKAVCAFDLVCIYFVWLF